MNSKGNKTIGKTKKYTSAERKLITRMIRKQWEIVKNNNPSSEEFAIASQKLMSANGIKSPDGSALTLRGVKYQVSRSGIRFKGRLSKLARNAPKVVPVVETVYKPQETAQDRAEIVSSLQAIPTALRGILEDDNISGKQRTAMFAAYFELQKQV